MESHQDRGRDGGRARGPAPTCLLRFGHLLARCTTQNDKGELVAPSHAFSDFASALTMCPLCLVILSVAKNQRRRDDAWNPSRLLPSVILRCAQNDNSP